MSSFRKRSLMIVICLLLVWVVICFERSNKIKPKSETFFATVAFIATLCFACACLVAWTYYDQILDLNFRSKDTLSRVEHYYTRRFENQAKQYQSKSKRIYVHYQALLDRYGSWGLQKYMSGYTQSMNMDIYYLYHNFSYNRINRTPQLLSMYLKPDFKDTRAIVEFKKHSIPPNIVLPRRLEQLNEEDLGNRLRMMKAGASKSAILLKVLTRNGLLVESSSPNKYEFDHKVEPSGLKPLFLIRKCAQNHKNTSGYVVSVNYDAENQILGSLESSLAEMDSKDLKTLARYVIDHLELEKSTDTISQALIAAVKGSKEQLKYSLTNYLVMYYRTRIAVLEHYCSNMVYCLAKLAQVNQQL